MLQQRQLQQLEAHLQDSLQQQQSQPTATVAPAAGAVSSTAAAVDHFSATAADGQVPWDRQLPGTIKILDSVPQSVPAADAALQQALAEPALRAQLAASGLQSHPVVQHSTAQPSAARVAIPQPLQTEAAEASNGRESTSPDVFDQVPCV